MNLTFVVPQGAEANAVRRAVPHARIVATAAGAAAAAALPRFRDAGVVVLGLCGALRSRTVGDVIVYREIAAGTGTVPLEHTFADALAAALPHAYGARGCSADHVITRRAERRRTRRATTPMSSTWKAPRSPPLWVSVACGSVWCASSATMRGATCRQWRT